MLALLVGLSCWQFGSAEAALAYYRGERLSVLPRLVDVGEGFPGDDRTENIQLVNHTDRSIRVVGGTSDCSCIVTHDLPIAIPAGETRTISITIHLPAAAGMFTHKAVLLTDYDKARMIAFRLSGRIVMPEDNSKLAQENWA